MIQNDWINIEEFLVQREFIKLQQKEQWAQHCHENWLKMKKQENEQRNENMKNNPKIGSVWQHHNGATYTVVLIANESSDNVNYPVTVVYKGFTNDKIWCKPLSNFLDKMTSISPKK